VPSKILTVEVYQEGSEIKVVTTGSVHPITAAGLLLKVQNKLLQESEHTVTVAAPSLPVPALQPKRF